jgi:DNA helicase HerA-like ATPase
MNMHTDSALDSDDAEILGKVASPPNKESTCDEFYFWVRRDAIAERTQIVTTECRLGGRLVKFYGLVHEVYRQGRPRNIAEACDGYDGDVGFEPPFSTPGVTYAAATILRTDPVVLAPPIEGCDVRLSGKEEAGIAYAADEIEERNRLTLGLIKNGGTKLAGGGCIDLAYLLGENGGHLNVNGVAGRGTKSSFLLHVVAMLLREARRREKARPSDPDGLQIVPIILNVKNFDLFYIDRASTRFDPGQDMDSWQTLGVPDPSPFTDAKFYAPQGRRSANPIDVGRKEVLPYSWSLAEIIRDRLFRYLFAEDDIADDNFEGIVLDVEMKLTRYERKGEVESQSLDDQGGAVRTFAQLIQWIDATIDTALFQKHHVGTRRKFQRRLHKIVIEGDGVLRREDPAGNPLDVRSKETRGPCVVDLHALAATPSLQRFVVAAIFRQLVDERTGSRARRGLRYLVVLDELNRFAPRGASDAITRLIETVAAEMRSQGIILLGAQQQASLVSTRVFENSGIKALGKSGSMEMGRDVWRFLGESARRRASSLGLDEKLIVQDGFREPMLVRVPRPPWALNPDEAGPSPREGRVRDEFDD